MTRFGRFTGILGLVIFLFGLGGSFLLGSFTEPLMVAHLVLGALMLLFWLVQNGLRNIGEASSIIRGRTVRFGVNALLYVLVFGGMLYCLNWFANRYDRRWDLTEEGVFSLASQSVKVIESLKKPLKIIALTGVRPENEEQVRDLLALYKHSNPKQVTAELLDPRTKPHLIDKYEIKQGNVAYLEYGEGDKKGVSRINDFTEETLTNAIIKLTRGEARKVYYVQGHDEPDLQSPNPEGTKEFASAVADEHLTMEPLILSLKPTVPEDAAAVVLVSPKKPLLPQEIDILKNYVASGGRLLMLTDPRTTGDVTQIAAAYGIEVGNNVVIDQIKRLFDAPALGAEPVVTTYTPHALTSHLTAGQPTIFNLASSVRATGKTEEGVTRTDLLKTGDTAWGETSLGLIFDSEAPTAVPEPEDLTGPVSLAAAYEKKLPPPEGQKSDDSDKTEFDRTSRVVVIGDSDFILNGRIHFFANRDLILNSVNWLIGEEGGVSLRPKSMRASVAPISRETFMLILASSFLIPEFILVLGLFVWWRRRAVSV